MALVVHVGCRGSRPETMTMGNLTESTSLRSIASEEETKEEEWTTKVKNVAECIGKPQDVPQGLGCWSMAATLLLMEGLNEVGGTAERNEVLEVLERMSSQGVNEASTETY